MPIIKRSALAACAMGLLAAAAPAPPVAAAEIDHAAQYRACMALAKSNPEQAFESALAWRDLGGRDAAEHCVAVALVGLKQYAEGATRLETLAKQTKREAGMRANLLGQAAQAWLLSDNPARAEGSLTAALKLVPDQPELLIDRAQARAALKDYPGALEDLDRSINLYGGSADAFAFRAATHRLLDHAEAAMADAEAALSLKINHPAALLERGILRRMSGDDKGARDDWLMILAVAPEATAATAARASLEQMDVNAQ